MKVKRGQIVWVNSIKTGGCVQDGERPVLVVSNDIGNLYSPVVIVVPLTAVIKKIPLSTHLVVEGFGLDYKSTIMTEQIYTLDKQYIINILGELDNKTMSIVDNKLKISLGV